MGRQRELPARISCGSSPAALIVSPFAPRTRWFRYFEAGFRVGLRLGQPFDTPGASRF